jgi:peptidoglycan/xylan/chitin deacetylase (PgdA/CDA1 family)
MPLSPNRVDYLPIIDRPAIRWPNGARVAFWVAPNIEHYEYLPPPDGSRNPWPRTPHPDVAQYSAHEYGNRVGFWRLLEILDRWRIRCSVTLNIGVLEHFPEIRDAMLRRDWTFVNHGFYNTRFATTFSEAQEREFLECCRETFRRLTGRELKGQSGPAGSNTERSPDLAAEAGFLYQTDWKIDDQPVPIRVRSGRFVCIPYTSELNDSPLVRHHHEGDYYAKICKAQFDQLYREGEASGRLMCIALHPYAMGRPHRAKYLAEVLDYVMSHDHVWQATTDEIAEHYLAHYYDQTLAHAARVNAPQGGPRDGG